MGWVCDLVPIRPPRRLGHGRDGTHRSWGALPSAARPPNFFKGTGQWSLVFLWRKLRDEESAGARRWPPYGSRCRAPTSWPDWSGDWRGSPLWGLSQPPARAGSHGLLEAVAPPPCAGPDLREATVVFRGPMRCSSKKATQWVYGVSQCSRCGSAPGLFGRQQHFLQRGAESKYSR